MAEVNLRTQLESLIQLQKVDTEIYQLKRQKEAVPAHLKELDAAFEEKKQGLVALEKKSLDAQKQKKDAELELGSKEEAIKKLQSQLYSLKTNKEYQTMLQQINDAKADCSVIEDKILAAMDAIDRVKGEVEQEKLKLQSEEKLFAAEKNKVNDGAKQIDERLAQLDAQRKQALENVDHKILTQYERILSSRDGLAIVTVNGNSCGGCNMLVPP